MSAQPYAVCLADGCGVEFANREEASQHGSDTMTATSPEEQARGVMARGHGYRVVNPTDEEIARGRIHDEMETALEDFCSSVDRLVERGTVTPGHVKAALRGYADFQDAWDDWMQEADS